MKKLLYFLLPTFFVAGLVYSDTPPPGTVTIVQPIAIVQPTPGLLHATIDNFPTPSPYPTPYSNQNVTVTNASPIPVNASVTFPSSQNVVVTNPSPIPISGTVSSSALFAGPTATPVPAQAAYIGVNDGTGKLVGLNANVNNGYANLQTIDRADFASGSYFFTSIGGNHAGTPVPILASSTGLLLNQDASTGSVNSSTPSLATLIGGTNSGNLKSLTVDGSSNLNVVDSSANSNLSAIAGNQTNGGQSSILLDSNSNAINSATDGTNFYISTSPSNNSTDNSSYVLGTTPFQVGVIAGVGSDTKVHALSTDTSGKLNVNAVIAFPSASPYPTPYAIQNVAIVSASPVPVTQSTSPWVVSNNENYVSATLTGTSNATISCVNMGSVIMEMTVTGTASVSFYASLDGTTFFAWPGSDLILLDGNIYYSATTTGRWSFRCAGLNKIQFSTSAITGSVVLEASANQAVDPVGTTIGTLFVNQTGTWNVNSNLQDGSGSPVNKGQTTMSGSLPVVIASNQSAIPISASSPIPISASSPIPVSGTVTVNQGTPGASPWPVSDTTTHTNLSTINTTLGTPMQNSGGSVTANAGTNLNTSALATSANQTNATQKTQVVDGSGNVIASTSNQMQVVENAQGSTGSTAPSTAIQVAGATGTVLHAWAVNNSGQGAINLFDQSGTGINSTANALNVYNTKESLGQQAQSAAVSVMNANALQLSTGTFNSTTGVLNWDMLSNAASGWYDAASFNQFSADIYTTTTVTGGVITFEQTNDTSNDAAGITLNLQDETALTQTNVTSLTLAASTVKHYRAPILARYVRFRISTAFAGTGTVGATVTFKQGPYAPIIQGIAQATAGSLNTTATIASGTVTTVSTVTTDNIAPGTTNGCMSPGSTLISVQGTTSGTAATQIIALTAGKKIFVCTMQLFNSSGTTPTFSLVYGTGSNCATGQTVLLPAFPLTAASAYSFPSPTTVTASANELCYLQTGTLPVVSYMITYTVN